MAQVAKMLGVSKDTVRRLFADEPGIIDLGRRMRLSSTSGAIGCSEFRYRCSTKL